MLPPGAPCRRTHGCRVCRSGFGHEFTHTHTLDCGFYVNSFSLVRGEEGARGDERGMEERREGGRKRGMEGRGMEERRERR